MTNLDETVPTAGRIAHRLHTILRLRNLRPATAAKLCEIAPAQFDTYLYGKHMPGAVALVLLAKGLDCSADFLLTGRGRV